MRENCRDFQQEHKNFYFNRFQKNSHQNSSQFDNGDSSLYQGKKNSNARRSIRLEQQKRSNPNRLFSKQSNEDRSNSNECSDVQREQSNENSSKLTSNWKYMDQYFKNKKCQICQSANQINLFLCDRCDDAFHDYCLRITIQQDENQKWICPYCQIDLQEHQNNKMKLQSKSFSENQQNCSSCRQILGNYQKIKALKHGRVVQIQIQDFKPQKCMYCKKLFHYSCFNPRSNALNCKKCQKQIRTKGPRNHEEFLAYIANTKNNYISQNYMAIQPLPNYKEYKKQERSRYYGLKFSGILTYWQLIARYQASLYYAFETKGLCFVQDQIYDKYQTMQLNCHEGDNGILPLNLQDQQVFERFKQNTSDGIFGPFEIRQDRIKGFYLVATDFLQKNTIICEYVGEVMDVRRSLMQEQNDSIFMLIKNPRSIKSLDVVPNKFCNIGRYLLGINNSNKSYTKLQNVKSIRFQYKGRARILFYCKRDIQAGQTLYFNYNGTVFQQYPTNHFTL